MNGIQNLLLKNRKWARKMRRNNPRFFHKLSLSQNPQFFWVGCADSRVPVNQIIESMPGQVFVHRNIANMLPTTDTSSLSSLQFAVQVLKVRHIIVCGHYQCGGLQAAINGNNEGPIKKWLSHVEEVRVRFEDIFKEYDESEHWELLCELNVLAQVINIAKTDIVQKAWLGGQDLVVHGWIYQISTGLLEDLRVHLASPNDIDNLNLPATVGENDKLRLSTYYKKLANPFGNQAS